MNLETEIRHLLKKYYFLNLIIEYKKETELIERGMIEYFEKVSINQDIKIIEIEMHKPFIPSIKLIALINSSRHKTVKGMLKLFR